MSRVFRCDSIVPSGFQHVADSLPQAIGTERVIEHDDYRRIRAGSDFRVHGTRRVNNFEVWIIQFEKLRQFPTKSMRQSHFGHQQVYFRAVSCGDPNCFLDTRGLYDSILARESTAFQSAQNLIRFGDQDRVGMPAEPALHSLSQIPDLPLSWVPANTLSTHPEGHFKEFEGGPLMH